MLILNNRASIVHAQLPKRPKVLIPPGEVVDVPEDYCETLGFKHLIGMGWLEIYDTTPGARVVVRNSSPVPRKLELPTEIGRHDFLLRRAPQVLRFKPGQERSVRREFLETQIAEKQLSAGQLEVIPEPAGA